MQGEGGGEKGKSRAQAHRIERTNEPDPRFGLGVSVGYGTQGKHLKVKVNLFPVKFKGAPK